jgi:hypothetical protein
MGVLEELRQLPRLLDHATTDVRAEAYRSLRLKLAYRREDGAEYVKVLASIPAVDVVRVGVGGALDPLPTRIELG